MLQLVSIALLCCILYRSFVSRRSTSSLPLPPGPKRLPIIGNLLDTANFKKHPWLCYSDWADMYGDVFHIDVLGNSVVVLNSAKATTELLEKRSANYSDRPDVHVMDDLMKWDFAHFRYGDKWRFFRRVFHQFFNSKAVLVQSIQDTQRKDAIQLLQSLRDNPQDFFPIVRHYVGSIILYIVYGYEVNPVHDDYVELAKKAMEALTQVVNTGTFLVDFFPILKYIPEWVPGAGFQRKARAWSKLILDLREEPFELAKTLNIESSFVLSALKTVQQLGIPVNNLTEDDVVRDTAGVAFAAGADTTVSVLLTFILAMVQNPAVQSRAQKEIEEVVGDHRLPDFKDRLQLPYVEALLAETLRWLPVTPLAVPHRSIQDDIYDGFLIPGGATIFANAWAILHDPVTYPDPSSFDPTRFLGPSPAPNPSKYAFGFGRRICPGRYIALNSAWLAIAAMLATYTFSPTVDENGKKMVPDSECTFGTVVQPVPFKCIIKPKSSAALQLIERGYERD